MTYAAEEKAKCAEREVRLRQRVYPRLIQQGRVSVQHAAREIEIMQEIAADYQKAAERERLL